MDTLLQDLRYGVRMLFKARGFTAIAVLSLALGIGANTTIFSLINAIFLNPVRAQDPARLMTLYMTDEKNKGGFNDFMPMSRPNVIDLRDQSARFEGIASIGFVGLTLTGSGKPERIGGEIVSGNYFDLLGVKAARGRVFGPEEDRTPGAHPVAVLSHGFWTRRFGGDPAIIGREIKLNGQPFTIIGVTPEGFQGTVALNDPSLWVPTMMYREVLSGFFLENFEDRRALLWQPVGRLKPGVKVEEAIAELKTIMTRLEQEYPEQNRGRSVTIVPLAQSAIHPALRRVFVLAGGLLMTVVGLVLLIACANVANLMLARAGARRKEIAIRLSLGAGRGRLVRQLMTESILLALIGGAAGLLVAFWGRDLLLAFRPPDFLPETFAMALDGRVLLFTLGVSLLTGVLFGLVPSLQASRPDLVVELKDKTSQPSGSHRRVNLRSALVVAQVALSLVSLIGAGLFLRSMRNAQRIDPGFETERLLAAGFDLGAAGYDESRGAAFHRLVVERVGALPGVARAALSTAQPIGGGGFGRTVFPEGMEASAGAVGQFVTVNSIGTGYLDTMDVRLLKGRDLTESDRENAPMVILANEEMVKRFWPDQDPIGRRFKFFGDPEFREVVGVVETTKIFTIGEDAQPIAYVPLLQGYEPALTLNVRTQGDPTSLIGTVRREIQALEPDLALEDPVTAGELIRRSLWAPQAGAALLAIFGALALVLAAIGIYGVMSYSVSQRTREFGIRMALGAAQADVLRLVLRQGMTLVAAGLAAGLLASLAATRLIGTLLFGVSPTDPLTFGAIAGILAVVALFAGWLPARRATRVDPMIALRYE